MKKKLAMLMCTALLVAGIAIPPALAAEQYYPISVEAYMEGDTPCIRKVYQLALSDDPSSIPTGDFERDGRLYHLLDMTRLNEVGVDTQPYTKTVNLDSDTGEMSEVLKKLEGQIEVKTEDGYTGTLILDHTSIQVAVKGYKTKTRSLSASRTFPNLSDADLSYVPKTIESNGKTLNLTDVQWSSDGTYYTAAASYTGTSSSRYATGYTVSANYKGEIAKTGCEVVTYTAIFESTEVSGEDVSADQSTPSELSNQPEQISDDTDGDRAEKDNGADWLPLLGCAGGGAAITAAIFETILYLKTRRA